MRLSYAVDKALWIVLFNAFVDHIFMHNIIESVDELNLNLELAFSVYRGN